MGAIDSKEVSVRLKSGRSVVAALEANKATAAEELFKKHGVPKDVTERLFAALALSLSAKVTDLEQADAAYTRELVDDDPARKVRDIATATAYDTAVKLRSSVEAGHGSDGAKELGYDGPTPQDPQQLVSLIKRAESGLQNWKPRPSQLEDYEFKAAVWLARLGPVRGALETALSTMAREEREADVALAKKNEALAAFDATFSGVAAIASSSLDAAGQKELARKVRPSPRHAGRTVELDSNPGDIAPPAEAAPTAAA